MVDTQLNIEVPHKMKFSPKCLKVFKTCNLYLCFLMLGMCVALPGPCLLDLKDLVHTDTQHIGFIYIARSAGYLLGSVVGGVILDLCKSKQAVLTICNLLIGGTMLGIPWSKSLEMLAGFMVVNGLSLGAVDIGGNVVCLNLWGSDSAPFYQALHFTFGLGGLIAPLVAAPFLGDHSTEDFNGTAANSSSLLSNSTHADRAILTNSTSDEGIPNIMYPFTIIGAYGLVVTFLFLFVCIMDPLEGKKAAVDNKERAKTRLGLLSALILLNCMLLFVETGTEIGYAQMLTTYAVRGPLELSASIGSYLTSTFWAAFTVSRLASVFLAIKISNFTLIVGDLVVTSVGAAVLLFLKSYEWSLWLASVLLGAGIASFFPAAVGWLDSYIDVTNKIASLFTVGAAFGEMVIPMTISYFIESVPEVLIYIVPASCIMSSLIVFVLYLVLRKQSLKNEKAEQTEPGSSLPDTNSKF